ncbi:MAG: DUF2497 domain-containing protein, partial [Rhodomicrobium sp.]|nr:DUF2497 domain-containing protein [Rhodomicrobium sp.]
MNRADQAPEPSMEELLASIRSIISDSDKAGTSERGASLVGLAPNGGAKPEPAQPASLPDDVFDLTDELVFPEELEAPSAAPFRAQAPAENPAHAQAASSGPALPFPGSDSATLPPGPSGQRRPAAVSVPRQEQPPRAVSHSSQPIWSRRELPKSAAPHQSTQRPRQDAMPPKSPPRNWAQDIQLPIPDNGPVPLIPSCEAEARPREQVEQAPAGAGVAAPAKGLDGKEEAAFAALAEKLARSAVGAMEASELKDAQQVDFEHLDEDRKADVTEKFAEVIERETVAEAADAPLPTLLNEVFRRDFVREKEPLPEPVSEAPEQKARPEAVPGPVPPAAESSRAAEVTKEVAAAARPARAPVPSYPVAPAQFQGAKPAPVPAQTAGTLEDAVREMLRPLLVQWL